MKNRRCHFVAALLFVACSVRGATLTVINTNDNLAGSLRQLIQDAAAGDTIVFNIPTSDPGYNASTHIYTVGLSGGELLISKDLTIDGGTSKITLRQIASNTRVINVSSGTVTLASLTVTGGSIIGNSVGGIVNNGTLILRNCTIQGNRGDLGGGGVGNNNTLTMINCTLQGNTSGANGRAISNFGTLTLNSCTIADNIGGAGAGTIYNAGTAHVRNCIIANNGAYDVKGVFLSDGYNFIGIQDANGSGFGLSGSHDQVGTTASPANPQLGALIDNGGPTKTMAPALASPVVDQGNSGLTSDQRGLSRSVDQPAIVNAGGGDASDVGAYELGIAQAGPTFTVNTADEHSDGSCDSSDCALWDAANAADNNINNNSVITFAPGVTGKITVTQQLAGMNLVRPMTIKGPGARNLTLSGENIQRVFNVTGTGGTGVIISGLTIANGNIAGAGGGITNSGNLTLQNCSLVNNMATSGGGGAIFSSGTLTLSSCTVANNTAAADGGGVQSTVGTINITNCTFTGNQGINGGGLAHGVNSGAMATIRSSTFTGNMASSRGGGLRLTNGTADMMNTLVANNTAPTSGPDLDLAGANLTVDYDLIRNINGWSGATQGTHNITGMDPQLDPAGLTNNGGPGDTIGLQASSVAINAGNDAIAPKLDERGYLRNGVVDVGAFEFAAVPMRITSVTHPDATHILLQGKGVPNATHGIQVSPDLNQNNFIFLNSVITDGTGSWQYNDAPPVGLTKRFYRATFP